MAWPSTWAAPDERMLQCALWALTTTHFARAAGDRAAVGTPGAWTRRRDELLATLRQMIGPFPERTPFKARVTGRLDKERYAICLASSLSTTCPTWPLPSRRAI
jgi:hypothetical protein